MSKFSLELLQPKREGLFQKLRKRGKAKPEADKVVSIAPVWARREASKNKPLTLKFGVK